MATLNLVLDTRRARKDGTYPLVFRIRIDKKLSDIGTGFKVHKDQFDLKNNCLINNYEANQQLEQLKSHYLNRLRAFMTSNPGSEDIHGIKSYLINKLPNEITVKEFWDEHIKSLRIANRNGGARVYNTSLNVLSQEINLNVPFSKIGYRDIVDLETKLFKRGVSVNGIGVYFRSFRAICNKAIHYDMVSYENYPFRKYKIRKTKTTPRVFALGEMKAYFRLNLDPSHPLYKSWLIGKLIFMLRGINISDLLSLDPSSIANGRINYKRKKTGKLYSIKLEKEIREIIDLFTPNKTLLGIIQDEEQKDQQQLIEILLQRRKVINAHLRKIGKMLEISEPLTTYVFRYSYANIAKSLGSSTDEISQALGHKTGLDVTNIYLQAFDDDVIDTMNRKVMDAVK